jgi:hypothetical protein
MWISATGECEHQVPEDESGLVAERDAEPLDRLSLPQLAERASRVTSILVAGFRLEGSKELREVPVVTTPRGVDDRPTPSLLVAFGEVSQVPAHLPLRSRRLLWLRPDRGLWVIRTQEARAIRTTDMVNFVPRET